MELLIVIGIITVLVGGLSVNFLASREKTKHAVSVEEMDRLYKAVWNQIALGNIDWSSLPSELTPIKDIPEIRDALVVGGESERVPDLLDPWGEPYMIRGGSVTTSTP